MLLTHASHPDPFEANGRSLTYDTMHQAILISRLRRLDPERGSYKCPNSSDGRGRSSHIVAWVSPPALAFLTGTSEMRVSRSLVTVRPKACPQCGFRQSAFSSKQSLDDPT